MNEEETGALKHSKFLVDSSRLADVDLKLPQVSEEVFANEYRDEQEKEAEISQDIKTDSVVQPLKRKPKKKLKRKLQ